ncbi:LuxR C-terminal-related transcriptional regulator [Blastococcus sp. CT_GayMR20]|uniref:LuxR C-terminal-related transcriptional regulator n=1 Tax=Blastococcus sp. CT_GayMR20 TaxID=2559609 RepID=UPI00142F7C74|nr:LuxR C-terminal-related transcriptional regulator [Blastococcus sp. CT_GayMR20]
MLRLPTARPGGLPVEILESKLYRPTSRPGVVPRPQLLARLRAAGTAPTVVVHAPAGYGKTTLLTLWAEADDRPFAWLSLDPRDNDPIVLLTHVAVALDRVSPLPGEVFDALRSAGASVPGTVVPRLGAALSVVPRPVVLVLDDVHHLLDGPSLDALVTLVGHVRGASRIALAGRSMPVPIARQRAQGRTVEIGVDDLAFTEHGARSLLRAAGADLPDEEIAQLARRSEGWAAGLYLAALSRTPAATALPLRDHGEWHVAAYLQTEVLAGLSPDDLSFLTGTAVVDRLSAPLCDAVLGRRDSAAVLDRLRQDNLFLVPLDGRGEWYRYHPLFRDLLRTRLDRSGPEQAPALLRRAADWFEADGQLETALHHAQSAEDVDRVARIAIALSTPMYASGRWSTLMSWFDWVDARQAVERHPAMAARAAYICALTGRPAAADRWADQAERWSDRITAGGGDGAFGMVLTTTRAIMCRDGLEQMRRDADDAAGLVRAAGSSSDTEYPMRVFLSGVANLFLGDAGAAEERFADATELTDGTLRTPLLSAVLSYRAMLAVGRGDWAEAEVLAARALAVTRSARTESHGTSIVVFTMAARVAQHRGEVRLAKAHLGEAHRIRPLLSHAVPWFAVSALLEMAEVSIGVGDANGARHLIRDAEAVLRRRPRLGTLVDQANDLRHRAGALQAAGTGSSTLTSAELRILPLLLTHLTVAGIADRLFLSRHTVKAQVWSMYRKLGVHSRDAAVARARVLGLLDA